MKKVFSIIAAAFLAIASLSAQDLESATALYNEGATALNAGDKQTALKCFEDALAQAEVIGIEAEELAYNCKRNIPTLINAIGKEQASNNQIDEAIATLKKALEKANEYDQTDIAEDTKVLIPQLYMQKGNLLLNQKKFAEAAAAYKEVININPNDATGYLRYGQACARIDDMENAVTSLTKAAELGQANAANKELANLYLSTAADALKTKQYEMAIENAEKAYAIVQNPTALNVIGTAAIAIKDYKKAIENFEGYAAAAPTARNIDQVKYQLATAYEATGDKANACVNYKAILNNPQFSEYAKHKVDVELKCN